MPIASCLSKAKIPDDKSEYLVNEWAEIAGVDAKDICINFINNYMQMGQKYSALVYLNLPDLWSENDVGKIQLGLLKVLSKHLEIAEDEIFIMTTLIQSQHVVENGEIVKW